MTKNRRTERGRTALVRPYKFIYIPMTTKHNIAVLISGNGSNLQALIDACEQPGYPAQIACVISNKAEAYGLKRAQKANIPSYTINHRDYDSRQTFDMAMHAVLMQHDIRLVCLAGFMRLLSDEFVSLWDQKMINIHPSFLPNFKGAHAIEDAFNAGVASTGVTMHYVIPEMDAGPIIAQEAVTINNDDNLASLEARIHAVEHQLYPRVVEQLLR